MIGISAFSKTTENLLQTRECVLNLPSVKEVSAVNRLALTTGSNPVPVSLAAECPVQLEAKLMAVHPIAEDQAAQRGRILSLELKIVRVHLAEELLMRHWAGCRNGCIGPGILRRR